MSAKKNTVEALVKRVLRVAELLANTTEIMVEAEAVTSTKSAEKHEKTETR